MAISEEQLKRLAEQLPNASRDPQAVRARVEAMEKILERAFVIPGINRPIGVDAIVGLVPIVGDIVTALMGAYIVWEARNLGMSRVQLTCSTFSGARTAGIFGSSASISTSIIPEPGRLKVSRSPAKAGVHLLSLPLDARAKGRTGLTAIVLPSSFRYIPQQEMDPCLRRGTSR